MRLLWPGALLLLGLLPLVVAVYLWVLRRRRRFVVRYSSLSLVRDSLSRRSWVRKYLPFALFLLALASLVLASSRPVSVTLVPTGRANIILSIDVSGSMRQTDILPSRLGAAQSAAISFIERQKANNQIGIVAFAGTAQEVQTPTQNTEDLRDAIESLMINRGTSLGDGILSAIDAIAQVNSDVAPAAHKALQASQLPSTGNSSGSVPDIIVLLTDGVPTTGPDPLEAAQQAAERGVRVYTIGFGTQMGENDTIYSFGGRFRRGIDEEALKRIADLTGGKYYSATSASELQKVFDSLPTYLITREETMEISVLFVAAGALLTVVAVILSQLWNPLP